MTDSDEGASPSKMRKLSKSITEVSSEADSSLVDMEAQTALEDIDACQNEIDALNEKASEEILLIEQKYNKMRKPHYEKRNELIKQIPNFWVTSFVNHPQISHVVSPAEEKCLQYLTQMEVSEFEDIKSGYCLSFHFAKNPYFSNEKISKSYFLIVKGGSPHSKSTEIQWKDGKDLSKFSQSKKLQSRVPGIGSKIGSFFSWFRENGSPLNDKIADILKDDIWPNPLQYYLAPDIEVEENGHTDDDDDDDDDSDDDDDDDGDSVVIVGDDDSDDDLVDDDIIYEVDDADDTGEIADESIELLEVEDEEEDEDDDDDVELIESDSELDTTAATNKSKDEKDSETSEGLSKPQETPGDKDVTSSINRNVNDNDSDSKTGSADEHNADERNTSSGKIADNEKDDCKSNEATEGDSNIDGVKEGVKVVSKAGMETNENSSGENKDQSEADKGKELVSNKTNSKLQQEEDGGGDG